MHHGGHLFLLGDNGSGKTTLLDAIHLVLTAHEEVEFNAAARVAGSSREGRRLQGIIMRQNIESESPLNPHGGISYAALEIEGRGKRYCFALGLRAQAMDDQVQYWGVIRAGTLEELPLTHELGGERFPVTRRELRELVGSAEFCGDLKSYRTELLRRLYGSEDLFKETCRLLRMGKAYREIAAGTRDYHELFKKLLPDPQRELFERVIRTLRELEQSNADLAGLEEKQCYLETLDGGITQIERQREAALRYQWLIHHLTCERLSAEMAGCRQQQAAAEGDLAQCREAILGAEREREELQRQLTVLQQADASGLLNLQQERAREEARLQQESVRLQGALKGHEQEYAAAERRYREARQQWQAALKRSYDTLQRLRAELPFSISPLLAEIDAQQRVEDIHEAGEIAVDAVGEETQQALLSVVTEQLQQGQELAQQRAALLQLQTEIAELTAQQELAPPVPGFREATRALQRQMIDALPLYRELEWKPGLTAESRAAIEEAIGAEVLGTLLVASADYAAAAQVIFPAYPGIRLARREEATADPPPWMRSAFDFEKSHPAAIRVLAEEMCAHPDRHPAALHECGVSVLHFRGHTRRLQGMPACLIGAERRREALQRQVKELEQQQKGRERAIRAGEKELAALNTQRQTLETLSRELQSAPRAIAGARYAAVTAQGQLTSAERRVSEQRAEAQDTARRRQECQTQLAELQARISNQGLDKLEGKQRKVTHEIDLVRGRIGELQKSDGVISERIAEHGRHHATLSGRLQAESELRLQLQTQLTPFAAEVESVAYYVLRTWRGQQFSNVENVREEWERVRREEAEGIGALRRDLNHPGYGALFAFTYDEAANRLVDRHMSPIHEVLLAGQRQIDEQREVINERTRELIRNIIMGDLFTELKGSVSRLRAMVRKINNLLQGRIFGSTRYRFRLEPERRYRDLLQVIEQYNPLDPAAQDELKQYLEAHKDEIMATEVNDIPAALDYRNWFLYELAMVSETEQGEVVMNRKTKSLGSGGEQAVPNYLLILTVAHFLYDGNEALRNRVLLFDEAFYGIDAGRRDQLLGFASDLGLQLFVASPDLDGVKQEIPCSTTLLVVKDESCNVHLFPCDFTNPRQLSLLDGAPVLAEAEFGAEIRN